MNWEAIGALGEIIGSIAVVLTLAYLAVQIRQSTKAARSASINYARAGVSETLSTISGDGDTARIYVAGLYEPDTLTREERVRFDLIVFQTLRVAEAMFMEYRENLLSDEIFQAHWRGQMTILKTAGGLASWKRQRDIVAHSFMEWVEGEIEKELGETLKSR